MAKLLLDQLLASGVHFGHKASRWNPKMFPYIYTERKGRHLIDLVQTAELLTEAATFVNDAAQSGKIFLFVGTKEQASSIIAKEALHCNSFYVNHRWLGGMLTNWKTMSQRIDYLKLLEQQELDGYMDSLTKKEATKKRKELEKLRNYLNGIKNMPRIPDVIIVVDQLRELTAVKEAISLNIPVISILDTNCDPGLVDLPIPGNDDSISSIQLILRVLSSNILSGQE